MVNWVQDTAVDLDRWYETPAEAAYVRPASSWSQDVINRIDSEVSGASGCPLPWSKVRGLWGLRRSELTVWAGPNGSGKSMVTGQVAVELAAQGERVAIASLEMPPATTLYRMTRQALGESAPMRERVTALHGALDGLMWIYDQMGTVQWNRIIGLGRYLATELRVQHFFIDSMVKLGVPPGDYDRQTRVIDELIALARDTGMHIHLVHHSRKGESDEKRITKSDIKGAGEIIDQADNAVIVWSNVRKQRNAEKSHPDPEIEREADLLVELCKNRDGEWKGSLALHFDRKSMQHVDQVGPPYEYLERLTE